MYLVVEELEAELDRMKRKKIGTKREKKKRRNIVSSLQLKSLTKFKKLNMKEERRKRSKTSFNFLPGTFLCILTEQP